MPIATSPSPGIAAALAETGFALVRGLLDDATIADLIAALEACRESPGRHYRRLSPEGVPALESELFRWSDTPAFHRLTTRGSLPALACAALGDAAAILLEDQWFRSDAGAEQESPWHQDHPYHPLEPAFLTIWMPLDPVPPGAGLRVVPRSHQGAIFAPVEVSATDATLAAGDAGNGSVPGGIPEAALDAACMPPAGPGDAILIDSRTLHAAGGSCTTLFRRLSVRYAPVATRIAPREWPVATFWDEHPEARIAGAALPSEGFPTVSPNVKNNM